jgi:hypothetical protein
MDSLRMQEFYAEAQERQARLTRGFFEASQEQVARARRGQAAGRNFAWEEPAKHYGDFLECLFFFYCREDVRTT